MRIAVIGAGSIGQLFAGYLGVHNPDISIDLYVSERYQKVLQGKALKFIDLKEQPQMITNICIGDPRDQMKPDEKPEILFLTAKAYSNLKILQEYKKLIENTAQLVILQNGLGNEQLFQQYFPKISIYRATTTNGALIRTPGEVIHTGLGTTYLGVVQNGSREKIEKYLELFEDTPVEIHYRENITKICWEKIFVNVPVNALGALFQVPNGKLLETPHSLNLMEQALKEAISVAKALKIDIADFQTYFSLVRQVLLKTSENRNSMLVDLEHGKPTEIDYINGKIAELGNSLGLSTPVNEILTQLIKGKEIFVCAKDN